MLFSISQYIRQSLLDVFGKCTMTMKVTLLYEEQEWLVEVDRGVQILCFEEGCVNFIDANNFKVGQTQKFVQMEKHSFVVYFKFLLFVISISPLMVIMSTVFGRFQCKFNGKCFLLGL